MAEDISLAQDSESLRSLDPAKAGILNGFISFHHSSIMLDEAADSLALILAEESIVFGRSHADVFHGVVQSVVQRFQRESVDQRRLVILFRDL